ncbi:MAG: 3-hydroxyisobutyrate dehydrogenase [Hyphomicrobiaceae bacterium]|nr:3-hydroxyisobutyrate dehydrogenase [Hyphomicrobiaceae bacterium]
MSTIGFIGLGNMGQHMARNLIKAGHSLKVFDLNEENARFVAQAGAKAVSSAAEAAKDVEFVVTMVPVGADVRRVFVDAGVIGAARPGTILIDSSTIDVDTARAMHDAAAKAGYKFLDAPVSGGVIGAEQATLTFMCGGDKDTFEKARPILAGMGKNIVLCGGPGQGQVVKICNNMMAAINMLAASEALVMGEKLGVDRKVLYDVITTSTGRSYALERSCPIPGPVPTAPSSNGFKPGFMAKLMLKDLRLSQMAAQSAGAATPLGAAATAAYAMHIENGNGDLDSCRQHTICPVPVAHELSGHP